MAMRITMPRGDIRPVRFVVYNASGEISDVNFDEIYFTVKKSFNNEDFLIQKRLSNGTIEADADRGYVFTIEPEDTNMLKVGRYVFDIELVSGTDIKQTIVGELELTNEVTYASNEV